MLMHRKNICGIKKLCLQYTKIQLNTLKQDKQIHLNTV